MKKYLLTELFLCTLIIMLFLGYYLSSYDLSSNIDISNRTVPIFASLTDDTSDNMIQLRYQCGSKKCIGYPETVTIFGPIHGSATIEISNIEPVTIDKGYTFWYWTNASQTKKYKSDCSGLSNCDTEILISKTNTLQAIWRRAISDIPQENENNSTISLRIISIFLLGIFLTMALSLLLYSHLKFNAKSKN